MNQDEYSIRPLGVLAWALVVAAVLSVVVALIFALFFGMQSFGRYQAIQNAQNQVQVNEIVIAQTNQLVQVEQQKAAMRVADAEGIAKAQGIINSSLTTQYLTYLAIQAQLEMAKHDHTATIYIPVGANGIPIIATQPVQGGK
jgi:hypothetical protein